MLDPSHKHGALCSRANYQLREIQNTCRQVTSMARHLNTLANEVAASEINTRKVEILKTEIKDKLRQYAASMDSIYQVLDRKIQLILTELKRMDGRTDPITTKPICKKCHSFSATGVAKEVQKSMSLQNEFSETLNPRVAHLQQKIIQYQSNEIRMKEKIAGLQVKNESLLEQFNRLSTASNKKINELSNKINFDRPVVATLNASPSKQIISSPSLQFSPNKAKKISNNHNQNDQFSNNFHDVSYTTSDPNQKEQKPHIFTLAQLPSKTPKSVNSLRESKVKDDYGGLDRNDRNRRFDLLLTKLRDSQQGSTDESHTDEVRRMDSPSTFIQGPIRRSQI